MSNDITPLKNVRIIQLLVADAPANFTTLAGEAGLCWSEEAGPWGTRYVVDLADLKDANASHVIVQQLENIRRTNEAMGQICLETK